MPIYTRAGDKGKTGLFNGKRVFKSHIRVDTYGTIDELNSVIGFAIANLKKRSEKKIKNELENIQHDLLAIGSSLAFPDSPPVIGLEERTTSFEKQIDEMTTKMPELKNFILPGGGVAGAALHIARVTARKAERRIVSLMQKEEIDEQIVKYINRLSDLFFTIARFVNFLEKQKETIWRKQ
jgi:cob(I)alamin adenosyltransferase